MGIYTKFTEHLWCGWESKEKSDAGEKPLSIRCITSDQAKETVKAFFKAKRIIDAPMPVSEEPMVNGGMLA